MQAGEALKLLLTPLSKLPLRTEKALYQWVQTELAPDRVRERAAFNNTLLDIIISPERALQKRKLALRGFLITRGLTDLKKSPARLAEFLSAFETACERLASMSKRGVASQFVNPNGLFVEEFARQLLHLNEKEADEAVRRGYLKCKGTPFGKRIWDSICSFERMREGKKPWEQ
jgi:hypothetical protein